MHDSGTLGTDVRVCADLKTCLLITEEFEPTADVLIAELRRRNVPCVRWNLDRFPIASSITYRVDQAGFTAELRTDGREVDLNSVGSIWCRGFRASGLPPDLKEADRTFVQLESQRALDALLSIMKVPWINHPHCQARANSKAAQLCAAREIGFDIPPTVITNDPAIARDFCETIGKTIYKSQAQSVTLEPGKFLFTSILTEHELKRLDRIRISPGIFQKYIDKAYEIRATVVGSRIFSGKINSQANRQTEIDWRHSPFEIEEEPINLPSETEKKIHALMRRFELLYGAFDFIVTPDNRYVFLEVNPAGQYLWVETKTKMPITAALADALSGPCEA